MSVQETPPTFDDAQELAQRYLERLAKAGVDLPELVERISAPRIADLHAVLAGAAAAPADPALGSVPARLHLALARGPRPCLARSPTRGICIAPTPPIRRAPMAPRPWRLRLRFAAWRASRHRGPAARGPWHRAAALRRAALMVPVLGQAILVTAIMLHVFPDPGTRLIEIPLLLLFAILNAWIGVGFWTSLAGFVLLLRGRDRHALKADKRRGDIDPAARTAIIMPICNEHVARVFAGLRATHDSLRASGASGNFDFFVLSDSSDPDLRVAEHAAWLDMCRACNCFGRIYYRLRQHRIKRKSGNIADFCRRWGRNYRYMVVLDADSVMTGRCLVELVRLMEQHPDTGIIQTAPRAIGRKTLYARIQQFASRAYGPVFVAGMHFWQLGESHYWGHNAIIRVAPFMQHCALARLPGSGTLSGEILSHDFVEAALMRRAGWAVWTAYDLAGSYEETPPNLVDELARDRRWCQGNLINSRLLFAHGLHPAHRAVFATGIMAYVSAPLWFSFLLLSTVALALYALAEPRYIVEWHKLFRLWPQWYPAQAIELFSATVGILLLPKALALLLIVARDARAFGGARRLGASALIEWIFSALLAPVRMLVHTQFVATALGGWQVTWKSPPRADAETCWRDALRRHGWHTLLGVGWAAWVYRLNPGLVWWLLPVAGALIVSIPVSVLSSRVAAGLGARRAGLFVIPEELRLPRVLKRMRRLADSAAPLPGFVDAVLDPLDNAVACASEAARIRHTPAARCAHEKLIERALAGGPDALTAEEKNSLLRDAAALSRFHRAVWTRSDIAPAWLTLRATPVCPPPQHTDTTNAQGRVSTRQSPLQLIVSERGATQAQTTAATASGSGARCAAS